jgi:hypothetical protein
VLTTTDLLLALQCALQAMDKSACGAIDEIELPAGPVAEPVCAAAS